MTGERWIELTCHPSTHTEAVRAFQVLDDIHKGASRADGWELVGIADEDQAAIGR